MAITYVHVNRNIIASNAKHGRLRPPVRYQRGKYGKPVYCHEVEISGPSRMIYSAHEPILPCGARLVIATESGVRAIR